MQYEFPLINHITDLLPAIEGRSEFVVAEKEGYTVVNYNVAFIDTFPPIKVAGGSAVMRAERSILNTLRRECRGIIFCQTTGDIIRRPYHKFFNVNERDETQDHIINMSQEHAILEKLDGSMIAPFIVSGRLIFGTKMGDTDVAKPVQDFVEANPHYIDFAKDMIAAGLTPIFEWCSRKQRIVLDYSDDQLILTAIRQMDTGRYLTRGATLGNAVAYKIPTVRHFAPQYDMKEFIEYVRELEDLEGFVVRFDDGHMVKLKCEWYVQLHRAKEAILQDRNIIEMVLNNTIDDVIPHLPEEEVVKLDKFILEFEHQINKTIFRIEDKLYEIGKLKLDRKTFALKYSDKMDQFSKSVVFSCWDSSDKVTETVYKVILNNLSKNVKYEAIRDIWFKGVFFNDR